MVLSTIAKDGSRRPLSGEGSTGRRKSGASVAVRQDRDRGVARKQVGLYDESRSGFAGTAGRGDGDEVAAPQYMCWPPLMLSVDPVMKSASSEVRKTTPRAMSCAVPSRPIGMRSTIRSSTRSGTARTMSVST